MPDRLSASRFIPLRDGIGVFITLIGMKNAGIIVSNSATLVSLGKITEGTALLAAIGLVITGVLYALRVRGAILIGILALALLLLAAIWGGDQDSQAHRTVLQTEKQP